MKKKRCTSCENTRTLSAFGKQRDASDGYKSICRDCQSAYERKYRKLNANRIAARKATYSREHRLELSTYLKRYRAKNAEKTRVIYRRYFTNNREAVRNRRKREYYRNQQKYLGKVAELSDSYLRKYLSQKTCLCNSDIPTELIELKRAQMLLTRMIKEKRA